MSASQQLELLPLLCNLCRIPRIQGPGFTLTVNGNGFNQDAVISVNGQKQTTTFMTANQLTTTIPASAIATPGTLAVTVTNPGHAAGGIIRHRRYGIRDVQPQDFTIN